jgi:hypothetical protein
VYSEFKEKSPEVVARKQEGDRKDKHGEQRGGRTGRGRGGNRDAGGREGRGRSGLI